MLCHTKQNTITRGCLQLVLGLFIFLDFAAHTTEKSKAAAVVVIVVEDDDE